MRLGDMLVSANLVTQADIDRAIANRTKTGGRLGDQLVALGAISRAALEGFTNQIPPEPDSLAATGINPTELINLLIKQIHMGRLETIASFIDAIKLPPRLVEELVQAAVTRKLLAALGSMGSAMRYELSDEGRRWAQESLKSSLYTGPAPVTLEEFCWPPPSPATRLPTPSSTRSARPSMPAAPCSSMARPATAKPPSPTASRTSLIASSTSPMR
jgi:hypothetical protein